MASEENQENLIFQACSNLMKKQKEFGFIYDNSDFIELIINYIYYFRQTKFFYPEEYFLQDTVVKKGLYMPIVDRMLLNKEVIEKIKKYQLRESILKKQLNFDKNKKFLYKLIPYCEITYDDPSRTKVLSERILKYSKNYNFNEKDILTIFENYRLYREGLLDLNEAFPYKGKKDVTNKKYSLNSVYCYLNKSLKDVEVNHPSRKKQVMYRINRDSNLIADLKIIHNHRCQICGTQIKLSDNNYYSEGHHIKPIGGPHFGPDTSDNILIVCANCHVMCDYGAIKLDIHSLNTIAKHIINQEFINYHNTSIYLKN
ncbi:HNH endonuclease [Jeotgalibaca sp. PTS2502]|uniref:HNH endonuclease n=1 Tax=Jeotgalibaca sp. PTS2502 TaxID=1903686 RepID=UPI0012EC911F|nr:HNH endonuclease [Jeotgalibaca sp. PTS2502]